MSSGNGLYQIDSGDTTWVLTSAALVLFMTPGLGFFYGGANVSVKSTMHTIMSSMIALPIIGIQWYLWGYTLSFSDTGCRFIGDMKWIGLHGVNEGPPHPLAPTVPNMAFAFFQLMFATVTPAIVFSGGAERMRMLPYMIFLFVWATLIYDIIAYWAWAPNGWFHHMGGLDYAGGMAVETASGFASFGLARALGRRKRKCKEQETEVNNAPFVVLGAGILWFGWIGFNAGSATAANARAAAAAMNTNFSAAMGAMTWLITEYFMKNRKWNVIAACNGAVAGLVAITPGAGYVSIHACLCIGAIAGCLCCLATKINYLLQVDDTFTALACHGLGGFMGLVFTGIFADQSVIRLDGTKTCSNNIPACQPGGWVNHHWMQILIQLAGAAAAAGWALVLTYVTVRLLKMISWLPLKLDVEDQKDIDMVEIGESGYLFVEKSLAEKSLAEAHVEPKTVQEPVAIASTAIKPEPVVPVVIEPTEVKPEPVVPVAIASTEVKPEVVEPAAIESAEIKDKDN